MTSAADVSRQLPPRPVAPSWWRAVWRWANEDHFSYATGEWAFTALAAVFVVFVLFMLTVFSGPEDAPPPAATGYVAGIRCRPAVSGVRLETPIAHVCLERRGQWMWYRQPMENP